MADKKKDAIVKASPSKSSAPSSSTKNYFDYSTKDPIADDYAITKQIGECVLS
jgi:hypothetical protein